MRWVWRVTQLQRQVDNYRFLPDNSNTSKQLPRLFDRAIAITAPTRPPPDAAGVSLLPVVVDSATVADVDGCGGWTLLLLLLLLMVAVVVDDNEVVLTEVAVVVAQSPSIALDALRLNCSRK